MEKGVLTEESLYSPVEIFVKKIMPDNTVSEREKATTYNLSDGLAFNSLKVAPTRYFEKPVPFAISDELVETARYIRQFYLEPLALMPQVEVAEPEPADDPQGHTWESPTLRLLPPLPESDEEG